MATGDPQAIGNFTASLLQQQTPSVLTMMLTAFAVELLRRDGFAAPDDMLTDEGAHYMAMLSSLMLSSLMLSQLQAAQTFVAMLPTDARSLN